MGKYIITAIVLVLVGVGAWKLLDQAPVKLPKSTENNEKLQIISENKEETSMPVNPSSTPAKRITYDHVPAMEINVNKNYTAVMTTDKGVMRVNLFAKETPVTVNNFIKLSRDGYYNDTVFHRIIKGFMIQGGDPTGTGTGSPGYRFDDEAITREYKRGTIAMANSGPNTNGSQFFIMHEDYALPKSYVIFGSIDPSDASSLKTLDALADVPVGDNGRGELSKPVNAVKLISVNIEER